MIYREIYDGPPRWYTNRRTRKKYIMIHATANDASAEGEADYAKRRPDRVSSHYYVDDDSIVQSLDTDLRAWHAGNDEGNDDAIAYELTARNMNVGRAWWVDLANIEWPLMVAAITRDCRQHGIEPRNLTVAQLRAGNVTGFCMHYEGNDAWGGSDHTDPGPNFPMDHLVRQVRAALEDDMPLTQDDLDKIAWAVNNYPNPKANSDKKTPVDSLRAWTHYGAWETLATARAIRAEQKAILAAVAGQDVAEAAAQAVREELAALEPALVAALGDVPAERVEQAVREVLGSLDEPGADDTA